MAVAERAAPRTVSRLGGRFAQPHAGLVAVVGLAALLRLATELAYRPALFFVDSWSYVVWAYDPSLSGFPGDRPAGYGFFLNIVDFLGRSLPLLVTVQHLAGMATGLLVYFLLLRLGSGRGWATLAAAIVLLDGYAITLEQYLMPEALFTLALTASAFLLTVTRRGPAALAASGALLAVAISLRTMGLFAVPPWILYVALTRLPRRALIAAAAGLLLPLLAYASAQASAGEGFAITPPGSSWFLYGRIGHIADCSGIHVPAAERPLCVNRPARERHPSPDFYVWKSGSPANRTFGYVYKDPKSLGHGNRTLRSFAFRIVRHRPLPYLGVAALDFGRFFAPGVASEPPDDGAIELPADPHQWFPGRHVRDRFFPHYNPRAHFPSKAVRDYQRIFHTPRWLMAILSLAVLALIPVGWGGRRPLPRRREALFLGGAALLMLLATAATTIFNVRYIVSLVPLLTAGGALALEDLTRLARRPRPSPG